MFRFSKILRFFNNYYLISFIISFLFAAVITYPLIFHLTNYVYEFGDELIIAYVNNWSVYAVLHHLNIFNASIYFPFNNSLSFSEPFFLSTFISFIPLLVFKEPIVTVNFILVFSILTLCFSVICLSYYVTRNKILSLISGLLIVFSPAMLDKLGHLQVLFVFLVPFSVLFLFKFIDENKIKFYISFLVCLVLQTYNSFMPGYFILFSMVIVWLSLFLKDKSRAIVFITKKNTLYLVLAIAVIVPITLPYFNVSREFAYVRDIRETIHFALQPEDLLVADKSSNLAPLLDKFSSSFNYPANAEIKPGFLGLSFSVLLLFSFIYLFLRIKKLNYQEISILLIAFFGLIMSFGPFLHIGRHTIHHPFPIPLPYALFYYLIPGFQGMRNSARWEVLFIIASAILVSIFLSKVIKNHVKQTFMLVIVLLVVFLEFNFPIKWNKIQSTRDFPKEYSYIASLPMDTKIIELPVYNWGMWPYTQHELLREYYATAHFRKTINGYSGFSPPPWQNLITEILKKFPEDIAIKKLKNLGVNYVLVHKDEYDQMSHDKYAVDGVKIKSGKEIIKILEDKKMTPVKIFKNTYIYKL